VICAKMGSSCMRSLRTAQDRLREGCDQIRSERLCRRPGTGWSSRWSTSSSRNGRSSAQRALGHVEALIGAFGLRDGACRTRCRSMSAMAFGALLEDVAHHRQIFFRPWESRTSRRAHLLGLNRTAGIGQGDVPEHLLAIEPVFLAEHVDDLGVGVASEARPRGAPFSLSMLSIVEPGGAMTSATTVAHDHHGLGLRKVAHVTRGPPRDPPCRRKKGLGGPEARCRCPRR